MRAWMQDRYGGPDAVTLRTAEVPVPGRGEVLLKMRATALNNGDVRVMRGEPLLLRLFFGLHRPRITGRGMDVAGTVAGVGPDVDGFAPGDEVVGELPGGGLAEWVVAPAARLVPRPAELDPFAAAALPVAGTAAWLAVDATAGASRVLVIGASGGVGTYTVQLAAERGAEVWALCGERSRSLVERLGATRTLDYRATALADLPGFDAVIDIAGTAPLRTLRALLRPGGRLVSVNGGENRVLGPIPRILWGSISAIGAKHRFVPIAATSKPDVLRRLIELTVAGRLAPVIERTWPLADAGEALAHVDAGHTVGKVVVVAD